MAKKKAHLPTEAEIEKFEMLDKLTDSIYTEMKEFSKKKPDEPLNKFKVKSVNRVLEQVKAILQNEPTVEFLDLLDDESLPSNSDSILILSQFMASMKQFHSKYWQREPGVGFRWATKENPVN
jgi:chromatin segregation and condensation protein Rec8/ScpA/Scc1 (kleisin family)